MNVLKALSLIFIFSSAFGASKSFDIDSYTETVITYEATSENYEYSGVERTARTRTITDGAVSEEVKDGFPESRVDGFSDVKLVFSKKSDKIKIISEALEYAEPENRKYPLHIKAELEAYFSKGSKSDLDEGREVEISLTKNGIKTLKKTIQKIMSGNIQKIMNREFAQYDASVTVKSKVREISNIPMIVTKEKIIERGAVDLASVIKVRF